MEELTLRVSLIARKYGGRSELVFYAHIIGDWDATEDFKRVQALEDRINMHRRSITRIIHERDFFLKNEGLLSEDLEKHSA